MARFTIISVAAVLLVPALAVGVAAGGETDGDADDGYTPSMKRVVFAGAGALLFTGGAGRPIAVVGNYDILLDEGTLELTYLDTDEVVTRSFDDSSRLAQQAGLHQLRPTLKVSRLFFEGDGWTLSGTWHATRSPAGAGVYYTDDIGPSLLSGSFDHHRMYAETVVFTAWN